MAPAPQFLVRSFQQTSMASLLLFIGLQLCDTLTTLVFLRQGVAEANPLIRFALGLSHSPAFPLLAVKAAGCVLAWLAWAAAVVVSLAVNREAWRGWLLLVTWLLAADAFPTWIGRAKNGEVTCFVTDLELLHHSLGPDNGC